jgi:hypothetical protein
LQDYKEENTNLKFEILTIPSEMPDSIGEETYRVNLTISEMEQI